MHANEQAQASERKAGGRSAPKSPRTTGPAGPLARPGAAGNAAVVQMLRAAGHAWAQDAHQHGDGSGHGQAPVLQRAKSVGAFAHDQEGDDGLSNQLVLDKMTALQLHTQQIYDQMRASMAELSERALASGGRPMDLTQYNLWSGPEKWATHEKNGPRYGTKERTGEYQAHQSPGFTMDQTSQHFAALDQLEAAGYNSVNRPRDPEYQQQFVNWLKERERSGTAFDADEAQREFLRLKATGAGHERAVYEPSDGSAGRPVPEGTDELVGWHGAQFGSAWEPTSDSVAKKAALAMLPVRSFGLDDPLADGTGVTHPAPLGTVQVRQEIPMVMRMADELADSLRENVEVRKGIARLASGAADQNRLNELAQQATDGINRFLQGTQLLDVGGEREERAKSADLMREGRAMFLSAVNLFDAFLRTAGCPAADCPPELTSALGSH
ncbi:hypothetical protein ACFYO9_32225 [Streptomyces sp. NPDC005863]|uniref:hypothetical protein n=1 Tax=unclassified Streptomyces TaxID=2593676 RepID=UPI0033FC3C1C